MHASVYQPLLQTALFVLVVRQLALYCFHLQIDPTLILIRHSQKIRRTCAASTFESICAPSADAVSICFDSFWRCICNCCNFPFTESSGSSASAASYNDSLNLKLVANHSKKNLKLLEFLFHFPQNSSTYRLGQVGNEFSAVLSPFKIWRSHNQNSVLFRLFYHAIYYSRFKLYLLYIVCKIIINWIHSPM